MTCLSMACRLLSLTVWIQQHATTQRLTNASNAQVLEVADMALQSGAQRVKQTLLSSQRNMSLLLAQSAVQACQETQLFPSHAVQVFRRRAARFLLLLRCFDTISIVGSIHRLYAYPSRRSSFSMRRNCLLVMWRAECVL